jgi:ribonuclease HII
VLEIENDLFDKGYMHIACIDEVGRGCLFGDVVACAVIMPRGLQIDGIKDSKKLSPKKREMLYDIIMDNCIAYGFGSVDCKKIDEINIKESTRLAMKMAVENLLDKQGNRIVPDFILIDAEKIYMDIPQEGIIKGDDKCYGIACASILAKVYRDRKCIEWGKMYPEYKIEKHKGYATKEHIEAIIEHGITPLHRNTFLKKILAGSTNE